MKMSNMFKGLYVDKKLFNKLFYYAILFFLLFFSSSFIFTYIIQSLSSGLQNGVAEDASQINSAYGSVSLIFFTVIFFIIFEIYLYSFFENISWNSIFGKATNLKNTNKFFLLNLLLILILVTIELAIFSVISLLPQVLIQPGVYLFYLSVLFAFYILYIGYVSYGKTHLIKKSIINSFKIGIKELGITIYPLIAATIISVVLNLGLDLLVWFPDWIKLPVQGIVLAAYMAWFKIYLSNVLKSVKF